MSNTIVRGTMLLTGATFLSKFLGMIYVIPFFALVGNEGGALYNFAYVPYNIFLSISTVGVPLAVSKFVSKYNSLEDYETGYRIFKSGMVLMAVTGFLAFIGLYASSGWIAALSIPNEPAKAEEAAFVIRMVSFALLVIPAMSIVRGFFQGYQSMGPTAVSQIVEQIVRIAFVLSGAFIVIKIYNGSIATAVGMATFAALIGALASCVVLWMYWRKRKAAILSNVNNQRFTYDIPMKKLFIELLSYAGPFIIVGLATSLYQLVDQFTFERSMTAVGLGEIWEITFSTINVYGHKIILIPVTIATGLSLAILPALTKSFTTNNKPVLFQQINQAFQIIIVLVLPASIGLAALADVAYGSLFTLENIDITAPLIVLYAPVSLLFAFFTVSAAVLQGINQQRFTVVSLAAGLLAKILLNIQLIHMFGAKGAIFGTALAVGIAVLLNLWRIHVSIQFSYKQTAKRALLVLIFSTVMFAVIYLLKWIFGYFLPYSESKFAALTMLIIGVIVGGAVYLWLAYASTLLERVLGNRVRVLNRIFHRRRS
ncbi:polysaccharide biosynthesis protein [Ornithinibacillus gellani]|uniref:putative polysaccharide biosynthesis protein n=1 Tax=Ornithinibacillus gellani TaxID=2293253 RepID=UPI000F46E1D6|nr:polysaccharide biosynthesis protein [Ornithinibacillus gellani]TQS75416.1 polysaccharide biosynthesis protein [Ornithinibacillus gellani]